MKFVYFRKVRTGAIKVRMDISTTIPTRLSFGGHAGLVFHQGQSRTCFNCGALRHESKKCPKKVTTTSAPKSTTDAGNSTVTPKTRRKRKRRNPPSPTTDPSTDPPGQAMDPPPPRKKIPPPSGSAKSSGAPPAFTDSQTTEKMDTSTKSSSTNPVDDKSKKMDTGISSDTSPANDPIHKYLFMTDSVEAAKSAPAVPTGEDSYPRHPEFPHFRMHNGKYIYVEEDEILHDKHPFPALAKSLSSRGHEIRELLGKYKGKQAQFRIANKSIMVLQPNVDAIEVPLLKWRSIAIKHFLDSQT